MGERRRFAIVDSMASEARDRSARGDLASRLKAILKQGDDKTLGLMISRQSVNIIIAALEKGGPPNADDI